MVLKDVPWAFSHDTGKGYIGFGLLYYCITYITRAKVAVCLGSGGGFVPRIMKQAQRDAGMERKGRTILIDGNRPQAGYGFPKYLHPKSFLNTHFPDIEIVIKTTKDAADMFKEKNIKIDYLHIDGDHSAEGTIADYETYRPFMAKEFIITIHDTRFSPGVAKAIEYIRTKDDIELIDFNHLSYGLAIVKPKLETGKVAVTLLKACAFAKHPIPHSSARLHKLAHKILGIFKV